MIATVINVALIVLGSAVGLFLGDRLGESVSKTVTSALGLCVAVIGVMNAIGTQSILTVIICLVVGTIIGERIDIEKRLDVMGIKLKEKVARGKTGGGKSMARFTEGFVTASLLYCIGSMAVMGSLEAGINHDYSILISKGVIDGVTSVTFAASMGIGVMFSVIPLFIYQGGITLLAGAAAPYLSAAVVTEMSGVGGVLLLGIAANMLKLTKEPIRVGNMLPALFLPIVCVPFFTWLASLPVFAFAA